MAAPTSDTYSAAPGTTIYAGRAAPGPGALVATVTLANTSASEQSAGFITPMFGHAFRQGDIPTGEFPVFKTEGGAGCPATIWGVTSWPDGSMKFCAAMVRVPSAVAGSGSIALEIWSGGSAPSASARSTADLTAADLKVELTGVANLTGTWTASLNDGITDASDMAVVGDGPAGKVWRIGAEVRDGSDAAHGQLYSWHYVAALQDASGNLAGLRYLGRVGQPWVDVTSPAVAKREFTATVKTGSTTIRSLQGTQTGETLTSTITLPHYASFTTAGADAKWDYVQGGGSVAADCTVRVLHDMDYLIMSRMLPPYDRSLSITDSATVDYAPMGAGKMVRSMGTTGEREDIGLFPAWYVRHIINQSANSERQVRVNGMCTSGWRTGLRKSSTKQVPAVVNVQSSYTGLGTIETGWRYWTTGNTGGMANPIPDGHLWMEEYDSHHRPQGCYYPYLVTGEPQYLDMLIEQASSFIMTVPQGSGTTWVTTTPIYTTPKSGAFHSRDCYVNGVLHKGAGIWFRSGLARYAAWMTRDVCQAAAIAPDVDPAGTGVKAYLTDVIMSNYAAINAYNALMPESFQNDGLQIFEARTASGEESPWTFGYMTNSLAHQLSILPNAPAVTAASQFAKYWQAITDQYSIAAACAYRMYCYDQNDKRIESISEATFQIFDCVVSFDSTTGVFTKSGTNSGFTVHNGDVFKFVGGTKPFTAASDRRALYAVESTGSTWKLSTTPGGAAETITTTGSVTNPYVGLSDLSPRLSYENVVSTSSYLANVRGCLHHLEAVGIALASGARSAADANWTTGGVAFTANPKNAYNTSFPV